MLGSLLLFSFLSLRFGHFSAGILLNGFSVFSWCLSPSYSLYLCSLLLSLPILLAVCQADSEHTMEPRLASVSYISLPIAGFADMCYHFWQDWSLDYLPEFLKVVIMLGYSCLCCYLNSKFFQPCIPLLVSSSLLM